MSIFAFWSSRAVGLPEREREREREREIERDLADSYFIPGLLTNESGNFSLLRSITGTSLFRSTLLPVGIPTVPLR